MPRVAALDQFRGLAVLGMLVVNFLAPFAVVRSQTPALVHHAASFGVADAFMPMFLFAAGAAFRLRVARGLSAAAEARRAAALLLLAAVLYPLEEAGREPLYALFKRHYFQALAHIGLSCLWVLPAVARGTRVRLAWAAGSLGLHLTLSAAFYHAWVYESPRCVEGGPLGFLAWSAVLLAGSLAADVVHDVPRLARWGLALLALGYAASCLPGRWGPPPFASDIPLPPDLFTMSQRAVTTPYVLFGTGLSLALLALFVRSGVEAGLLRTLGTRALAAYVFHLLALHALRPFAPKDAGGAAVLALLALFLALSVALARRVELRL